MSLRFECLFCCVLFSFFKPPVGSSPHLLSFFAQKGHPPPSPQNACPTRRQTCPHSTHTPLLFLLLLLLLYPCRPSVMLAGPPLPAGPLETLSLTSRLSPQGESSPLEWGGKLKETGVSACPCPSPPPPSFSFVVFVPSAPLPSRTLHVSRSRFVSLYFSLFALPFPPILPGTCSLSLFR